MPDGGSKCDPSDLSRFILNHSDHFEPLCEDTRDAISAIDDDCEVIFGGEEVELGGVADRYLWRRVQASITAKVNDFVSGEAQEERSGCMALRDIATVTFRVDEEVKDAHLSAF